ncbi:flagellar motor stator protein MotA [Bacillaceae bacterium SIJ1]|uniref:flagellar motor stator protein MotA n=1 Tax=Litoribacterium kuwaitense TaxID=1398745 RepID=UPI0013EC00F4|nr:flagellar motor stator protein MotA [Litoribacterium kuwaitense]NGP45893.1 flagellar motor stator protein MotA [Litoribacterium kuwaitense]
MDKTSLIGIFLGFIAIALGMVLKGVSLVVFLNPAAILIILVGTAAAVFVAFPTNEMKKVPKLFGILFKEQKMMTPVEVIGTFSSWTEVARKEGLLMLESKIAELDDAFLKNGMQMAIDGQNSEYIRDVLSEEIDAMEERHAGGAQIFSQAGTYAPTLGVLGAVIGLIAALGNMSDIDKLGEAISAAFVATLMGIFTGYVLWHPFANKLKQKSKAEVKVKEMMIEGILSLIEGESPKALEQKLTSYLSEQERSAVGEKKGAISDDAA